jgi:Flp pilus assembly protein CpaB
MVARILLVVGVLLGIVGGFGTFQYIQSVSQGVVFLKANRDIATSESANVKDFDAIKVPQAFTSFGGVAIRNVDFGIVRDRPPTVPIQRGDILLYSHFDPVKLKRTVFDRLPSNKRAISIPVGLETSVANIIAPGDRVDVIGTFANEQSRFEIPRITARPSTGAGTGGANLSSTLRNSTPASSQTGTPNDAVGTYTHTILQNVSVLGVGQMFNDLSESSFVPGQYSYSTVTLGVSPVEASLLVFAQDGAGARLTLALRHPEADAKQSIPKMTFTEFEKKVKELSKEEPTTLPGTGVQ